MTDDVFDPTKLSRRSLLVGGGLAAAGLTTLGTPSLAFGPDYILGFEGVIREEVSA